MAIGLLILEIHIPGCGSLKEKRSRLKPLMTRLRREFNISVAEIDYHDIWQSAAIACAQVSNDAAQIQRALQKVSAWIEIYWPDVTIVADHIEMI